MLNQTPPGSIDDFNEPLAHMLMHRAALGASCEEFTAMVDGSLLFLHEGVRNLFAAVDRGYHDE
jgi:hypothetical protein